MRTSESLVNIAKALVAVEKDIKNPKATKDNPFFHSHYAPLDAILEENRPLLAKHNLAVVQSAGGNGEGTTVTTMLLHTSGEFIESDPMLLKPDKDTPQGAGSAVTYGRRYSLSGMLGIASEDDDDANAVSGERPQKSTTTTNQPAKENLTPGGLPKDEVYRLQNLLVKAGVGVATGKITDKDELATARENNRLLTYEYLVKHDLTIANETNPLWYMAPAEAKKLEDALRLDIEKKKPPETVIEEVFGESEVV